MRGSIMVPNPKVNFCTDASLYNRLRVRNRNIRLVAKDVSYKVNIKVDKRTQKVLVDDLQPDSIHGFHLEDAHNKNGELVWPYSRISDSQIIRHKQQFVNTLQGELCDQLRQTISQPQIQQSIIEQV